MHQRFTAFQSGNPRGPGLTSAKHLHQPQLAQLQITCYKTANLNLKKGRIMELQTLDSRKDQVSAEVTGASLNDGFDATTSHKSLPKHINVSAPSPADADKNSLRSNATGARVTRAQRKLARFQYATLLWTLMLAGWNDGTNGPLLPRIQEVYHVSVFINLVYDMLIPYCA